MSIAKLEQAARQACSDPSISCVFEDLPREYRDNPNALRRLLVAVAEGTSVAHSAAYRQAHAALYECEQAYALRDTIGRLVNDPKVLLAAADKGLNWYLEHPQAIREALRDPKIANALGQDLSHEIAMATIESQHFATEHGIPDSPPPAAEPVPSEAGARESEIKKLVGRSVEGKLTKTESDRLNRLYESRLAEDATDEEKASHRKALGLPEKPVAGDEYLRLSRKFASTGLTGAEQDRLYELTEAREAATPAPTSGKTAPDEYKRLIGLSVDGRLSPEQNARLNEMSGERAVASGAITREDLAAEQQE